MNTETRCNTWSYIWRDIDKAVHQAESTCRKLRLGAYDLFAEWVDILCHLDFWNFCIAQLKNRKTLVHSMLQLATQINSPHFLTCTLKEAYKLRDKGCTRKRVYKRSHKYKWDSFIRQLVEELAACDNITAASALTKHREVKKQQWDAQQIKYA